MTTNPNVKHHVATREQQVETNSHLNSIDQSIELISQKMNAVNVTQVAVFVADFVSNPVHITHGYLHTDERIISTQ